MLVTEQPERRRVEQAKSVHTKRRGISPLLTMDSLVILGPWKTTAGKGYS
jgi:hypothetical protein